MSSLNSIYMKKETIEKILSVMNKKEMKGIEFTISISDDANNYDQNVTGYVAQTKEEREAKKDRFYVGNGRTFWTDGRVCVPPKKTDAPAKSNPLTDHEDDDLF